MHAVENTKLRFGFQLFGFRVIALQAADGRAVASP